MADGKQIEELVATIEGRLLPLGFEVKKNTRVYNDNGVQVAEFDVEIRGKLGSTEIAWLLECRNRPGEGPAPGAWIEQLVGRRSRFNFNKVTAVSTTGFAQGAIEYAAQAGIELRAVEQIAPELARWLGMRSLTRSERRHHLHHASFVIAEEESPERAEAAQAVLRAQGDRPLEAPILLSTQTGERGTALQAFLNIVAEHPELWADVLPNQEPKPVSLRVEFADHSHFVLDTALGPVRIKRIDFDGTLSIKEWEIPLEGVSEYRQLGGEKPIAQSAGFIVPMNENKVVFELHQIESGEIMMTVRQLLDS